jgi:hypothetical protein
MKTISKAKLLKQALGGSWKYDGKTTWWDNESEERRHVSRVKSCSCDDYCPHVADYYLYNVEATKLVIFGNDSISFI